MSATPRVQGASRLLLLALALVLAVNAGLFVAVSYKMLTYPHEVIVTEGAIGLAVHSILDGVPLYHASRWEEPPYVIVHYTPLYYLAAAGWTWLAGGGLFAGRWISILSTAATAVLAGCVVRREVSVAPPAPGAAGGLFPALLAGGLWLSFYQVIFWGTTQRVDALGTCLEAAGVLAYLAARRRGRPGYGALPWLVAAWATKQVMIVALVAASIDLWVRDRRAAWRFAATGFGAIAAIFALLVVVSGGGFWTAAVLGTVSADADPPWVIFSNAELFFGSPWNMLMFIVASWAVIAGLQQPVAGAQGAPAAGGDRRARAGLAGPWLFLGLYLWLGLALAIATDANLPRFFPPMLAMALLVPLFLHTLRPSPALLGALVGALVFTGATHTVYELRSLVRERILTLNPASERLQFAEAVRRHAPVGTPVLAQDVGMLLSAGSDVVVADPYVFSILAGNNAWDPEARLGEGVQEQRFAAVVLNRPLEEMNDWEWTTLWIAPTRRAIARSYRLAETVSVDQHWRFLEPTRWIYVPGAGPADAAEAGSRTADGPQAGGAAPATSGSTVPEPTTEAEWRQRGAEIVAAFRKELQGALQGAIRQGAPEAIGVCRLQAPEIAARLSTAGIEVGRTSHKLRNPANAPRPWTRPLLEAYRSDPQRSGPKVVRIGDDRIGYAEPIFVQPLCLTCHGEALPPAVAARIDALYPDDDARGFTAGDFRGLFWVELPARP